MELRRETLSPVFEPADLAQDDVLTRFLLEALASNQVGVCLCDADDIIRYCNTTFRRRFFPDLGTTPNNFVDAIAASNGIQLTSMSLEAFVPRVKERRRHGPAQFSFTLDLIDGTWWRVNDHRLPNGWILAIASDVSCLKEEEHRLRDAHASAVKAAQTDWLTGLANRRYGMERLDAALVEFRDNRLPLTVALLDLDHFKLINDVHGHDVGDRVLIHFARTLMEQLGPSDQVSRIGGEEFLVVMPGTPPSRAQNRLRQILAELSPCAQNCGSVPLGFSFSAGLASACAVEPVRALLGRADAALYSAKANGRCRIEVDGQSNSEAA